jgi:hypothetical protein
MLLDNLGPGSLRKDAIERGAPLNLEANPRPLLANHESMPEGALFAFRTTES